jgi:hypothetical protein
MTDTWIVQSQGQWDDKTSWSENRVPTVDDDVDVPQGEANITTAVGTIASLLISGTGNVEMSAGSSLQVQEQVIVDNGLSVGGHLTIQEGLIVQKTGSANVGAGAKIAAQSLKNLGTVSVSGTLAIQGGGPGSYQGHYIVEGGGQLKFNGGAPTSIAKDGSLSISGAGSNVEGLKDLSSIAGTFSLSGGQSVAFAGGLDNSGSVTLNDFGNGGQVSIAGALTNSGLFNAIAGTLHDRITVESLDNTATGRLSIGAGSTTALVMEVTHGGSSAGEIDMFQTATLLIDGTFRDSGTLSFNGGPVEVAGSFVDTGSIAGSYVFQIDAGGSLELTAAEPNSGTVQFHGTGATLQLKSPASFAGRITGFAAGDILDLVGKNVASAKETDGDLTVTLKNGQVEQFNLTGSAKGFQLKSDGHGGTDIVGLNHATKAVAFALPVHDDPADHFAASAHHYGASIDLLA